MQLNAVQCIQCDIKQCPPVAFLVFVINLSAGRAATWRRRDRSDANRCCSSDDDDDEDDEEDDDDDDDDGDD